MCKPAIPAAYRQSSLALGQAYGAILLLNDIAEDDGIPTQTREKLKKITSMIIEVMYSPIVTMPPGFDPVDKPGEGAILD